MTTRKFKFLCRECDMSTFIDCKVTTQDLQGVAVRDGWIKTDEKISGYGIVWEKDGYQMVLPENDSRDSKSSLFMAINDISMARNAPARQVLDELCREKQRDSEFLISSKITSQDIRLFLEDCGWQRKASHAVQPMDFFEKNDSVMYIPKYAGYEDHDHILQSVNEIASEINIPARQVIDEILRHKEKEKLPQFSSQSNPFSGTSCRTLVLSLSEIARCLGVYQEQGDTSEIDQRRADLKLAEDELIERLKR